MRPRSTRTTRAGRARNPPTSPAVLARYTSYKYKADPAGPGDEQRTIKLITEQHVMYVSMNKMKVALGKTRQGIFGVFTFVWTTKLT